MISNRMTFLLCAAAIGVGGVALAQSPAGGDWPTAGQNASGQRYSPLNQVNTSNVAELKPIWTYSMRPASPDGAAAPAQGRPPGASQVTPLMVKGLLYLTTPARRIVAVDATTGKEVWAANGAGSTRGVEYWPGDAVHAPRILYHGGPTANLVALNALTGERIASFGQDGVVGSPKGATSWTSPPKVYKNIVISGAANPNDDGRPEDIRAFDVVTGKQLWRFATLPEPGQPGSETWPANYNRQWRFSSGTAVGTWGFMTVDEARGVIYIPIDTPQWERYGGDRAGDNLYSNSVIALDAKTGKLLWHFQVTHHDLWDLDMVGAPVLFDVKQRGKTVPAVGMIGKSGILFILNRVTGKPIYDVVERPVAKSDVPGEISSPTQPYPARPAEVARTSVSRSEIAKVTPELFAACTKLVDDNNIGLGGPYNPPGFNRPTVNFPGANGSANWGGMSLDPKLNYLIVNTQDLGQITTLGPKGGAINGSGGVRAGTAPIPYDMVGLNGRFAITSGNTLLPCQEPPWGRLSAVDVNTGKVVWQTPLGITESLPADKQNTGRPNLGHSLATAGGLVFIGASDDNYFRAFETKTGKILWQQKLRSPVRSIISYADANGRQIILAPVGDVMTAYSL